MDNCTSATGHCLCGAVSFTANASTKFGACHCDMCRRWGGGPLLATSIIGEPEFKGQENITIYNSSAWAERGFCKKCGSHLFYKFKSDTPHYNMPTGLFSDLKDPQFTVQVYIDKKPNYYDFENKTQNVTEAEIIALYMAKE